MGSLGRVVLLAVTPRGPADGPFARYIAYESSQASNAKEVEKQVFRIPFSHIFDASKAIQHLLRTLLWIIRRSRRGSSIRRGTTPISDQSCASARASSSRAHAFLIVLRNRNKRGDVSNKFGSRRIY